jgi:hypothetical protein
MQWPVDIVPSTNDFKLNYPSRSFKSPFTGVSQSVSLPGASWEITLKINNMKLDERHQVEVLTDQLKGSVEPIKMVDHCNLGEVAMGLPVAAVSGKGRTLQTSGWTPSKKVLSAGNLITVNSELKRVQEDVFSSASGLATITFNPPLRKIVPLGAAIETKNPWMWATLKDNGVSFSRRPGDFTDVTMTFIEAIYR